MLWGQRCFSKSAWMGFSIAVFAPGISASAMSLSEAVNLAISNNPAGKAEQSSRRAATYDLGRSRGQLLPQVELFGDAGAQRVDDPSLSLSDNRQWHFTREIGVKASLVIFDGFERANRVYRNAARVDAAVYRVLATSERLALNAVEAYIDVVRHRQLAVLANQNVTRHREILEQIRERVAGGTTRVSDLFQAQERVFAAESVEIEVRKALEDANGKFRRVVGVDPRGKMTMPRARDLPASQSALVDQAIANNYEVGQADKIIREREYGVAESKSAYRPKIFLDGRASAGADRFGSSGTENDLYIGLRLSWKLYDGSSSYYNTLANVERQFEAQHRRDLKVREVREVAERAWNSYVSGRKRYSVIDKQVASNRKVVENYIEEYQLSKRTLLDVLDSERALFNSRFEGISAHAAFEYGGYRMLASASKLAASFGITEFDLAPSPDTEERIVGDPLGIFKLTIDPLE